MRQRSEVTEQTAASKIKETYRKIQGITTYWNKNPETRNVCRNQYWDRKLTCN